MSYESEFPQYLDLTSQPASIEGVSADSRDESGFVKVKLKLATVLAGADLWRVLGARLEGLWHEVEDADGNCEVMPVGFDLKIKSDLTFGKNEDHRLLLKSSDADVIELPRVVFGGFAVEPIADWKGYVTFTATFLARRDELVGDLAGLLDQTVRISIFDPQQRLDLGGGEPAAA